MYSRLIKIPRNKSFFLFGPRGIGKSTWVKDAFPNAPYIDLLKSDIYFSLQVSPSRLEDYIPPQSSEPIIIDEIQRIPDLLNEVHRLIENRGYQFILTGSSARSLRKKGVNLLAGRALTKRMYPLTSFELGEDFEILKALRFGMLPSIYSESNPQAYLESYVQTYLREEIQQEGLTRSIGAFSRFLETSSFSQGAVLNISAVSRECSVERKVVENYFTILDDLLLAYRLPVFSKKAKRKLISHQKFYIFDVGVYRAIRPRGPLDSADEIGGSALETLFLQEIVAVNAYFELGFTIYYWRTPTGNEVDFVLYGNRGLIAFEIKSSRTYSSKDAKGLRAFSKDYPIANCYLLYGGKETFYDKTIQIKPIQECLHQLPKILNTPNP